MKLHLGCGDKYLEGFIHCDIRKYEHVDYVVNLNDLSIFKDNSADEIYACHVLEHFGRFEIEDVLKEWNRVLKKDGILRICVPNFDSIVDYYRKGGELNELMGLLYGGQDYEYNFHKTTFTFDYLKKILLNCGFYKVKIYEWDEFLPKGYDDFSRAYLPHMDFENGLLMSLNLIAIKKS